LEGGGKPGLGGGVEDNSAEYSQFHIDPVIFLVQWLVAAPLKMLNKRRSAYKVTEVYKLIGHL